MTDGNTLIVDVVQKGDDYILNDTPINMMIAYEVVRRHVTDNGTFYSQLTKKQKTAEGYSFVFDTGDTFTCASDTAYPTSSSISDSTDELPAVGASDKGKFLHANESTGALEWAEGGGSGGGVLVVHETVSGSTHTLDKTFKEIKDAGFSVLYIEEDGVYFVFGMSGIDYSNYSVNYSEVYTATSEDGYPSCEQGH